MQIGEDIVGVRIAIRGIAEGQWHRVESHIYNWNIKKIYPWTVRNLSKITHHAMSHQIYLIIIYSILMEISIIYQKRRAREMGLLLLLCQQIKT